MGQAMRDTMKAMKDIGIEEEGGRNENTSKTR